MFMVKPNIVDCQYIKTQLEITYNTKQARPDGMES